MALPSFSLEMDEHSSDDELTSRDEADIAGSVSSQESVGFFDDEVQGKARAEDHLGQSKLSAECSEDAESRISQYSDFSDYSQSQWSQLHANFEKNFSTGASNKSIQEAVDKARDHVRATFTYLPPRHERVMVKHASTQTEQSVKKKRYLCVYKKKNGFQAFTKIKGKDTYIGRYASDELAARAVDDFILARTALLDAPRRLNFSHASHPRYVYDVHKKRHLAYPDQMTLPSDF